MLKYFKDENIFVAVSLDGAPEANDMHRQYPKGAGTYDHITRCLKLNHNALKMLQPVP